MRTINYIVIHSTATRENERLTESMLEESHRALGREGCGYHFYVRRDGNVVAMCPLHRAGVHAVGYNAYSIGIAYEGGLDCNGNPCDTRTERQKYSLQMLISSLLTDYPDAQVCGHRDLSPDIAQKEHLTPQEWEMLCPCFDVETSL